MSGDVLGGAIVGVCGGDNFGSAGVEEGIPEVS